MKIFAIGSDKTATTSLGLALVKLGFRLAPKREMFRVGSPYLTDFVNGEYGRLFGIVNSHDAVADRPWNYGDFYKVLDGMYPGSKFILTVRNTERWIASYRQWAMRFVHSPDGMKTLLAPEATRHDGVWRYAVFSRPAYTLEDFMPDERQMVKNYEDRNREVVDFFSGRDNLLVMDIERGDGWIPLCKFLNKPAFRASVPFPWENKTKDVRRL